MSARTLRKRRAMAALLSRKQKGRWKRMAAHGTLSKGEQKLLDAALIRMAVATGRTTKEDTGRMSGDE